LFGLGAGTDYKELRGHAVAPIRLEGSQMPKTFKTGDHVRWNSEAGRVSGIIIKKITSNTRLKGYVHASREEPQYLIKSDKTEHVAIHKGNALRLIPKSRISGTTTGARKK
jgi:DUF2945 family protein